MTDDDYPPEPVIPESACRYAYRGDCPPGCGNRGVIEPTDVEQCALAPKPKVVTL